MNKSKIKTILIFLISLSVSVALVTSTNVRTLIMNDNETTVTQDVSAVMDKINPVSICVVIVLIIIAGFCLFSSDNKQK